MGLSLEPQESLEESMLVFGEQESVVLNAHAMMSSSMADDSRMSMTGAFGGGGDTSNRNIDADAAVVNKENVARCILPEKKQPRYLRNERHSR